MAFGPLTEGELAAVAANFPNYLPRDSDTVKIIGVLLGGMVLVAWRAFTRILADAGLRRLRGVTLQVGMAG